MIGKPKYKLEDNVKCKIANNEYTGTILVVDKYGTFENNSDVCYDIYVKSCEKYPAGMVIKHVPEHLVNPQID